MGVWERLRLSSTAFLNSADWATMFAVGWVVWFEERLLLLLVGIVAGRD